MRRLAEILLPLSLLPALALPLSAAADPLPSPGVCPASGPQVCFVDASETPQVTIPAGSSDMTYLHVRATVLNRGTSTATHLSITEAPPPGLAVAALSGVDGAGRPAVCLPSTGACSYSNLQAGRSVTIDAVLAVSAAARPTTAGTDPNLNTLTARVDEGINDNPANGGKVDTTPLSRPLNLVARDGTSVYSYVPAGVATALTTDKNGKPFAVATSAASGSEVGTTEVPALSQSVAASVARSGVGACPGSCAMTDWMAVSVPDFPSIASYLLKTTVRVDSTVIGTIKGLNANTVVVWYQPDLATTPVALPRCTITGTGLPSNPGCFVPTKEKDGDITVVVYERHNGRIRL